MRIFDHACIIDIIPRWEIDRLLEDVERRDLYSRCKLATEIACRSCIIYRMLFAAITVLANVQRLYTM